MSREPLTIWGLQQRTLESMNGMTKADMRQELLERLTDRLEEEGSLIKSTIWKPVLRSEIVTIYRETKIIL